jgi:hypothetical protein
VRLVPLVDYEENADSNSESNDGRKRSPRSNMSQGNADIETAGNEDCMKYEGGGRKMDPSISPIEAIVAIMKKYGVPMTRENFLVCGGFEGEPDAEQEAEIPLRFRLCENCYSHPCRCTIPGVTGFECECEPCAARRKV